MPAITIRNVSPEARNALAARAALAGLSLQEYLRNELESLAGRPTTREWATHVAVRLGDGGRAALDDAAIVEMVHADRR
jgi:antitoxin FitA